MKKFTIIGSSIVLLIVAFLLWHHSRPSKLTGTWVANVGNGRHNTTTVRSDGAYTCKLTGLANGQVLIWEGRMDVKGGTLVTTITNEMAGTNKVYGIKKAIITHAKIIRLDDHALVIQPSDTTNSVAFTKQ